MHIKVVPYQTDWPEKFKQESALIKLQLKAIVQQIHHMGSTSVPGLMAKPVIDILMEVTDLAALDSHSYLMEQLGYEVMGAYGIPGRRYFRKGGYNRTHHVHAFLRGDDNIKRHLAFRDYLIAHPKIAAEYGQLKKEIADRINHDIEDYCVAKVPFIKQHEQLALEWYEKDLKQ